MKLVTGYSWILALAVVLGVFMPRVEAQPTVWTFIGASSVDAHEWGLSANWDDGHGNHKVPVYTDRAVVPSTKEAHVTDTRGIDTVDIEGKLLVEGAGLLILHNAQHLTSNPVDDSLINGFLDLASGGGGYGEVEFVGHDHTLWGTGQVTGYESNNKIVVDSGILLTNKLDQTSGGEIEGKMIVDGGGTFVQDGLIEANSGTISFGAGLSLADDTGSVWKLNTGQCGVACSFAFGKDACLVGDMVNTPHTSGTFSVKANVSIQTTGTFTRNGAAVTLGSGAKFEYWVFDPGTSGTCSTNPGILIGSLQTCDYLYGYNGYIVGTSQASCCN